MDYSLAPEYSGRVPTSMGARGSTTWLLARLFAKISRPDTQGQQSQKIPSTTREQPAKQPCQPLGPGIGQQIVHPHWAPAQEGAQNQDGNQATREE